MTLGNIYSAILFTVVMYNSANSTKRDISKIIENDVNAMITLSSIKSDIDQNMRQSQNQNSDYVDYEDIPRYAYNNFKHNAQREFLKQLQGEGRSNNSHDDNNHLISPNIHLSNSTVQTLYFPRGILLVSGGSPPAEANPTLANSFGLISRSASNLTSNSLDLSNAFIIVSITAAVLGLAALNYFTLQTQLTSISTATSICQAARQVGDLNIPLCTGATGADLNRAIDAINSIQAPNCN